jgi:isopropylmalate/homocitrate/citramalate synthase
MQLGTLPKMRCPYTGREATAQTRYQVHIIDRDITFEAAHYETEDGIVFLMPTADFHKLKDLDERKVSKAKEVFRAAKDFASSLIHHDNKE